MRLLGKGGTGEVYLARDTALGRRVALKLIQTSRLNDKRQDDFLREARLTAGFSHPNIVTVYAIGEMDDGRTWLALEYVEGETLWERFRRDRPGARESLRILYAMAAAMAEAHAQGVLHRDLKPGNVLIGRDGRVRVLDFGLAVEKHRVAGGERHARGTPSWMSPEQWTGGVLHEATDIWSFGLVMHMLLTHQRPWPSKPVAELIRNVCSDEPTPVHTPVEPVPDSVIALLRRCLAKNPRHRPTAVDILRELEASEPSRRVSEERSPYRGLLAFSERHADAFFGRDDEVNTVVEQLRDEPLLTIVGPSGAGKSSFVLAGVVPRLRDQADWRVLVVRPGARPLHALAMRLIFGDGEATTDGTPSEAPMVVGALEADLAEKPAVLGQHLRKLAASTNKRVLLVVDQLEEAVTLADDAARSAFLTALAAAADDAQDPVRIIATVRDDFLGRVVEDGASLGRVVVLRRPDAAGLAEIIRAPLRALGYDFDDAALPEEMVAAVEGESQCLPMLQFTCRMLWERRDANGRVLRRSDYDSLGGVEGALAAHADAVLAGLSETQLGTARQVLLQLVTPEETRSVVPLSELHAGSDDVVQRLVEARLLTLRRSRDGVREVELAHESLITGWDRLARWLDDSADDREFLEEIRQAAVLWEQRGERVDEVWVGDALRDAHRHLSNLEAVPERVQRFVEAGQAAQRRVDGRRRALLGAGAGALLVVTAVSITFALAFRGQVEIADARSAEARQRSADAELAAARGAFAREDLVEARARLRTALELEDSTVARALWWSLQRHPLEWKVEVGAALYDVVFAPDGSEVVAASQNGSIYRIGVRDQSLQVLRGHRDQVAALAFDRVGGLLSGSWSGDVYQWNLDSGTFRALTRHDASVASLAISEDRLASASQDGVVKLAGSDRGAGAYDVGGSVASLAFSPDGARLAVGVEDRLVVLDHITGRRETRTDHTGRVWDVAWSAEQIATASWDGTVRLTDHAGRHPRVLQHEGAVNAVEFAPDGGTLATGGLDRDVHLWSKDGERLARLRGHGEKIAALAWSPDGSRVASGAHDRTVRLWRTGVAPAPEVGHSDVVNGVDFLHDGAIVSASYDGTIRIWDRDGGQRRVLSGHDARVYSARATDDGRIVSAGGDNAVRLWDLDTGESRVLHGHTDRVYDVHERGGVVVSGGADGTVRVWDAATGRLLRTLTGHQGQVFGVARAPWGVVSSGADATVRAWLDDGSVRVLGRHDAAVIGVAVSDDGTRVASGSDDGSVRVWTLDGAEARYGPWDARAYRVQFAPDGRLGVTLSDGRAMLIGLDGAVQPLLGHTSEVNDIAFRSVGKQLDIATVGDDATVMLWADGQPVWRGAVRDGAFASHHDAEPPQDAAVTGACTVSWDGVLTGPAGRFGATGELLELPDGSGCAVLGRQGVLVHGAEVRTIPDATAMAVHDQRLHYVAGERLYTLTGEIGAIDAGVVRLHWLSDGTRVLGFADGSVRVGDQRLQATPSSAATAVADGPRDTVVVGFADGTWGLWERASGAVLERSRLHGAVIHLAVVEQVLQVGTRRGERASVDLTPFYADWCTLLQTVWSEVGVVWEDGRPIVRGPSAHSCLEP